MNALPTLSVVIPSVGRQGIIPALIDSLARQSKAADQIVIVDQSAKKDSALAARTDITYLCLEKPNTPDARNSGVNAATGDIIIFFDDDIEIPDTTLLEKTAMFFHTHPHYVGLAFTIIDNNTALNRENQKKSKRVMAVTTTGRVLPFAQGEEQDVTAPRGGGVAYRKSAILAVGGFDNRFRGNAMREETDFSLRVVRAVGPIRYVPELSIVHLGLQHGGSRLYDRKQWYFDFFANEMLFQLLHTERWTIPLFIVRKLRPILACWLWYGKGKVSWLITPFLGLYEGIRRYRKGFSPFPFKSA